MLIKGNTGDWEIIVGLEVHAQINTNSKLFSGASNEFGCEQNENVAFVDAGMLAISILGGLSKDGLPMGLQIIGFNAKPQGI